MDPIITALFTIALLLVLILMGMHVGVALSALSLMGIMLINGNPSVALSIMSSTAYSGLMDYVFGAMPMFIIMGVFSNISGASEDLYESANVLMSRIKGGLGIATVLANALFAAITGISVASAAVFSSIAVPQMNKMGYNQRFSLGIVAGSSLLGMLIPPSMLMIVYAILTEESIGKLFIAGIIPGILLTAIYCLGIYLIVAIKPRLGGNPSEKDADRENLLKTLIRPWIFMLLVALVIGGIYAGWFTPTEAGAVGAFGAFIFCLLRGRLTWGVFKEGLLASGYTTSAVYFLLISATMYSKMLTISGLPRLVSEWVVSLSVPPLVIVAFFILLFLILGSFIDSTSILLVTIPLMLPVIKALGMDAIWFGIVAIVAVEIGIITPPFGMVCFAMKAALGESVKIEDIFIGAIPFIIMMAAALVIIVLIPPLSTYLPCLM